MSLIICIKIFITGRNEVSAKVIFSQVSVCPQGGYPSMPCRSVPGGVWSWGSPIFRGVSNFSGGSPIFWGSPIFLGGVSNFWGGGVSNFLGGQLRGDPPIFWGGNFFLISAFFGDTPPSGTRHRNTVNVRPVRILLECILVRYSFIKCTVWQMSSYFLFLVPLHQQVP